MNNKYTKLIISIVLDAFGFIPIPFIGFVWAPISAFIMTRMYQGKPGKVAGVISFLEELLPLDILPTFTIMWVYNYVISNNKDEKTVKS